MEFVEQARRAACPPSPAGRAPARRRAGRRSANGNGSGSCGARCSARLAGKEGLERRGDLFAGASHGAKWPTPGKRDDVRSSTSSSRPSSWTGSSALSSMPQMTSVGTCTLGNARRTQVGQVATVTPGGGTDHLRGAVPVEHRGERARLRPFGDVLRRSSARDLRQIDMPGKALVEEPVEAHRFDRLLEARRAEGGDILRRGALVGVLDQALLKNHRVRRIDDRQPRQARIAAQRRRPGNRAAPVVADQRKALDAKRVRQREDVGDQRVGLISRRPPAAGR